MTDGPGQTIVVLYRGEVEVASWPLRRHDHADLATVDELVRLHLVARRHGCAVRLRHAGAVLQELLDLTGLAAVVTTISCAGSSVVEVGGQSEGGEQGGVEEVVVPDDPVT